MPSKISRIIEMLEKGLKRETSALLSRMSAGEIVHILRRVSRERQVQIIRTIEKNKVREAMLLLTDEERSRILSALSDKEISELIFDLPSDDACRILRTVSPQDRVNSILMYLPERKKRSIIKQLRYSKEVAGGIMQREMLIASPQDTVGKIVEMIKNARPSTYTREIYVVDENLRLLGRVDVERLLTAKASSRIKDLMTPVRAVVHVTTDREDVAALFRKHRCLSIPVVEDGKLVGVITIDEALKIMEEEHTEDLFKMFSLDREERVFDPLKKSLRNRTPWLLINLLTAFLAASVVNIFDDVLKTFVLLAVFMPVVAGEGGNATTQTMAIVVRSLALGEITSSDFVKVLKKEMAVALLNGVLVGFVAAALSILWKGSVIVALALFLAMIINMVVAAVAGATIPLALKKLGSDPASSSTVILTTFTDVFGFMSFLGIGAILLKLFGAV